MIDLVEVAGSLGKAGGAGPGEGRNTDHLCRFGAEGDGVSIYVIDPEGN